ncbi:NAD-dependent epimerase/dehydratase family protein [Arthrobacter sp. ISL-48]|uniref:NAD-dependent epimerase/dehydratase family protein n=1 Tax=Arthrobacter sp. ISL-48 TaxID=2819110 RepID=UPI001BE9A76A|nr:NAD-dependent epimerase/dehydratase family protein [Arthrobacter sp. ISL-48]MBT2532633.1 NAD-dependent epimerase/dehydratase family protein [Arthrobacter sp. ISL-48]
MPELHVITGAGPVGWTVSEQLAEQGHRVRVLTRSGSGPEHPLIERVAADARNSARMGRLLSGASAVYHCIHGSAYRASAWQAELPEAEQMVLRAAGKAGAVVVFPESLYSYSDPDKVMTEDSPRTARGGKRGVRTLLLHAREESETDTVSVVAGDFFGPRVRTSHAGERMVPAILRGSKLSVIGSTQQPHSFTYVPDLAAAMIRAARTPELWNKVWHAPTGPAITQHGLSGAFAEAAGVSTPSVRAIPGWALRATGLFSTDVRELAEMLYQFEKPFIMDSAASESALGLRPTPLPEAAAATVGWWRAQA